METNSKPWWDESIHWGLCGYSFLKTPRSLWLLAAIILIVWNWSMEWAYEQRERVKDITGYLKFCHEEVNKPQSRDGQDQPSPDKLYKLRRFLGKLLPKYDQEWVSHQWLTTDEQMIPFRGRVGFQQFEKKQPSRFGIKVSAMAEGSNGCILRQQIYTGKMWKCGCSWPTSKLPRQKLERPPAFHIPEHVSQFAFVLLDCYGKKTNGRNGPVPAVIDKQATWFEWEQLHDLITLN